ncbi:MAG TPA: ribonuclease HI [Rectinemataceae bacterium]|nr:ribonuclease HI [Rectinemataceae bacterium]
MASILIHTDGGCSGNPGPGGWAFVMHGPEGEILGSGGEANTTNNRMELRAVIEALRRVEGYAPARGEVELVTDSQYVKNGITTWIASWKRNGWKTASKAPVKNRELWEELDAISSRVGPRYSWVKGHAGHEHNERCDALVQVEIAKFR